MADIVPARKTVSKKLNVNGKIIVCWFERKQAGSGMYLIEQVLGVKWRALNG